MTTLVRELINPAFVIPKHEKHVFRCRKCQRIYIWKRYVKHAKTSKHCGVDVGEVNINSGPSGLDINVVWC